MKKSACEHANPRVIDSTIRRKGYTLCSAVFKAICNTVPVIQAQDWSVRRLQINSGPLNQTASLITFIYFHFLSLFQCMAENIWYLWDFHGLTTKANLLLSHPAQNCASTRFSTLLFKLFQHPAYLTKQEKKQQKT